MNRGGVGSASIVLVFAVLCLTIFTVISYVSAMTERNLIESEVRLVKAYYVADTLAERVLGEILALAGEREEIPEIILGVEIEAYWDEELVEVSFSCAISDTTELYTVVAIRGDEYEILTWKIRPTVEWESDDRLDVWQGHFDAFFFEGARNGT